MEQEHKKSTSKATKMRKSRYCLRSSHTHKGSTPCEACGTNYSRILKPVDYRVTPYKGEKKKKTPRRKKKEIPCSICLEDQSSDPTKTMKCGHKFHVNCIESWLSNNTTCPNCRATLKFADPEIFAPFPGIPFDFPEFNSLMDDDTPAVEMLIIGPRAPWVRIPLMERVL